ncbi:MAG: hypothetical protein ACOYCD_09960, partial [Kiritimatiellia bacterium]
MAVTFGLAQDKIPVGVLKSGQTPNWADGIYQMLDFEKDFQAEIIYDATPATLSKFKAVIVPQLSNASKYKDWIEPLRSWVEAGGGLMTTHDAVGYRMHPVIFPEIAKGHFHYFDESKKPFWVELCLTRERPFTTFLRQGDRIPLAYYDYPESVTGFARHANFSGIVFCNQPSPDFQWPISKFSVTNTFFSR